MFTAQIINNSNPIQAQFDRSTTHPPSATMSHRAKGLVVQAFKIGPGRCHVFPQKPDHTTNNHDDDDNNNNQSINQSTHLLVSSQTFPMLSDMKEPLAAH